MNKKIIITSEKEFYTPLFKGLCLHLEESETLPVMTTNDISRKFAWNGKNMTKDEVSKLLETQHMCTCGKKDLNNIHYVTHILSNKKCVIGSTCIGHWFNDDVEFKTVNEKYYIEELNNFTKMKKIIQFDRENIQYCKTCFKKTETRRCPCKIKKDKYEVEKIKIKKIRDEELVQFSVPFSMKDRMKEYAKCNDIQIYWNKDTKKWSCKRKYEYLFEIIEKNCSDVFYFEIDWKEFELL